MKIEDFYINFDDLKDGDGVWHNTHGYTTINRIYNDDPNPIKTVYGSYTKKGYRFNGDKCPTIYKSNPFEYLGKVQDPTLPEPLPQFGEEILVWDDDETKTEESIYLGYIRQTDYPVTCVELGCEEEFKKGLTVPYYAWKHWKPLPKDELVYLTMQDISDGKGFGVPAHLIRVKV